MTFLMTYVCRRESCEEWFETIISGFVDIVGGHWATDVYISVTLFVDALWGKEYLRRTLPREVTKFDLNPSTAPIYDFHGELYGYVFV